jgi:5'-methylthioadenosine phosphorylase
LLFGRKIIVAEPIRIAVIGGSGLYGMPDLTDIEERTIDTPFGPTSDAIMTGKLEGILVAFVARHGRGHVHTPTMVPYQANIYALKTLGVERIISVSACGSLREEYAPRHIVVPDQLVDRTNSRPRTFFGEGVVAHIGVADPFCVDLSAIIADSTRESGGTVHEGGTFITIEGPRFSTRGESELFRSWGMSIIGMTTSPEAYLAREAEICYGVMAHVTDYDVWHESEEPVTTEMVIRVLMDNTELAQQSIKAMVGKLAEAERNCECCDALGDALFTDREKMPAETKEKLKPIIGRYVT